MKKSMKIKTSVLKSDVFKGSRENINKFNRLKKLLVIAILFLGINSVNAQIQFGFTGGLNASTQSEMGTIWNKDGICCQLNGGLVSKYELNDWMSVKLAMVYIQKGRSVEVYDFGSQQEQKEQYNYLEVPLYAQFYLPKENRKHRLFAEFGPYASILLNSNQKIGGHKYDTDTYTKDADYGISFGIGIEIPIDLNKLEVSLSYDMGLREIADYDTDLRNKSLSINVGWFF